ncbi:MAG: ScpA family protein [Patescibacteria group bacterium]|nr:ScpA family protein [Patescibacteria group bacterium]
MAFAVKLEKFEGPLDLLLELIEGEKLDISTLSLATVTDGYLLYLQEHPEIPPDELADFLVVASRLLLIKSRLLLPYLNLGEEELGQDLETQLRIYKEYLEASKVVTALIGRRRFLFVHEKLPHVEIGFAPPTKLTASQMAELFRAVLKRLDIIVRVPQAVIEKTVSIHEKIQQIQDFLRAAQQTSFREILSSAESRTEIVICFLALLELIKQKSVCVAQDSLFGEISVSRADVAHPVC